ncbi:hypothetical protein HanRHA438_Chr01g0004001 [Helianthus annuus]|nr:hypothetical protein HanRHA438_Chr01g0004001 [Helianthus annuus]
MGFVLGPSPTGAAPPPTSPPSSGVLPISLRTMETSLTLSHTYKYSIYIY